MEAESYREDLSAALLRIEQLEDELALFRSDPSFERVALATENLARARERRQRLLRALPLLVIASFTMMGAFALTDPTLPPIVRALGQLLAAAGAASAVVNIVALLLVSAQPRPRKLVELERQLRIAKGDVGDARRVRILSERLQEEEAHSLESFDERLAASLRR